MSDIENQDLYDGTGSDTPLIDSLGSAVKRLIDKGKIRGYITVEEPVSYTHLTLPTNSRV